jgi:hypothetical protein
MATGGVSSIDEGHVNVGMVDEGIREGHAHGSGADYQIVGRQRASGHEWRRYKTVRCRDLALAEDSWTGKHRQLG